MLVGVCINMDVFCWSIEVITKTSKIKMSKMGLHSYDTHTPPPPFYDKKVLFCCVNSFFLIIWQHKEEQERRGK